MRESILFLGFIFFDGPWTPGQPLDSWTAIGQVWTRSFRSISDVSDLTPSIYQNDDRILHRSFYLDEENEKH